MTTKTESKDTSKVKLIQFYAIWCAPCRAMEPIIESIKEKMDETLAVERIDVESDSELVIEHQIRSVPTILLLKNDRVVWKHLGTISETELSAVINANLTE